MKRTKVFSVLLACLVMLTLFAACNRDGKNDTPGTTTPPDTTTPNSPDNSNTDNNDNNNTDTPDDNNSLGGDVADAGKRTLDDLFTMTGRAADDIGEFFGMDTAPANGEYPYSFNDTDAFVTPTYENDKAKGFDVRLPDTETDADKWIKSMTETYGDPDTGSGGDTTTWTTEQGKITLHKAGDKLKITIDPKAAA